MIKNSLKEKEEYIKIRKIRWKPNFEAFVQINWVQFELHIKYQ
jgi:hypothetical protein